MACLLAAALLASPAAPPPVGVYFEQTTITYAGGRAEGPGVMSRIWSEGPRMRLEAGETVGGPAFILRLDTGTAFRIEPKERRAVEIDVARLKTRSRMDLSMAGDLMGADAESPARTRALAATRTVAGLPCQSFRISQGSTELEMCVTNALGVGVDAFADFLEWSGASQALGGLLAEIRRLKGFPLETRSRVLVLGEAQETRSTVTKVVVGRQPQALFEPPAGYALVHEETQEEEDP